MSSPASRQVIVTGASSLVARYLLPKLVHAGFEVTGISRCDRPEWIPASCMWRQADIAKVNAERWIRPGHDIVNLAPLPLLAGRVAEMQTARIVAFSTTSVITKQGSADPGERRLMDSIRKAEADLISGARAVGVACAVLRPTMIYDGLNDKNIVKLRRFIRRWGFLPLANRGKGLRQPVHADDLASACLQLLGSYRDVSGCFVAAGAEQLAYREMVERIFRSINRYPRIIDLPSGMLKSMARVAHAFGFSPVSAAFVDRMAQDMVFDIAPARAAFGYSPRAFDLEADE